MRKLLHGIWFVLLGLLCLNVIGAGCPSPVPGVLPLFKIRDTTVTECKGVFTDSEAGKAPNPSHFYGEFENFTFVIQVGGPVYLKFSCFDSEAGVDTMSIYDGAPIPANLITTISGNPGAIPTVVAPSGTMTIKWVSDGSIHKSGWVAQWRTDVPAPEPPRLVVNPAPSCSTTTLDVTLTKRVHCDSIYLSAFTLTGPGNPILLGASGFGCPTADDSTGIARLSVAPPGLAQNCTYTVSYTINILDECDSMWTFLVDTTFDILDCPIPITLTTSPTGDTICPGSCVDITASSTAASCLPLSWSWNNGLGTGTGPKNVCPATSTTYVVNVNGGGPTFSDSIRIVVINPQIPIGDTTVCQSDSAFLVGGIPSGGTWTGPGMLISKPGYFDPDTAGGGTHWIYYGIGSLCRDSVKIQVTPIDAGPDDAACPGGAPFTLTSFYPASGYWTGPFVDSMGVFTPSTPGTYVDTFYANGCMDTKLVYVGNPNSSGLTDSICQNTDPYGLDTTSGVIPGGRWSGAGILDSLTGLFDPDDAGAGLHNIIYKLANGCQDTVKIFVKAFDMGYNRTSCPTQGLVTLNATSNGGTWSSPNPGTIIPPGTNPAQYDPSVLGHGGNDYLIYTMPNGCVDTVRMYVRQTTIYDQIKYFCIDDDSVNLTDPPTYGGYINSKTPCCSGAWTTPAPNAIKYIGKPYYDYYFYPAGAGPGTHWLRWTKNSCYDTIPFIVYPNLDVRDTTICSITNPFSLGSMPDSTDWFGPGVNKVTGMFTPATAGPGTHIVGYTTPAGCSDSATITIYPFQPAQINGLSSPYCYKDSAYSFTYGPSGASISFGQGTDTTTMTFNPTKAGQYDTIIVSFGVGECMTSDTMIIQVYPQLTTSVTSSQDTICGGGSSLITISPSGGNPNNTYNYSWSHGLSPSSSNNVVPDSTTTYVITTSDGCSDPAIDSVTIFIFPDFTATYAVSDTVCYGLDGYVVAKPNPAGDPYSYYWGKNEPDTDSLVRPAGKTFFLKITNTNTGCHIDTSIRIPVYSVITALFSPNPDDECIPYSQHEVRFIDLSTNALKGTWDLAGDTYPYQAGFNPSKEFKVPGEHKVTLIVENEGQCADTFSMTICVQEDTSIFVPDAFSPNGDGVNDILYARAGGYKEFSFIVFNRFGQLIFESTESNKGWNGNLHGKEAPQGVYVYYVKSITKDNNVIIKKGDVTLVR